MPPRERLLLVALVTAWLGLSLGSLQGTAAGQSPEVVRVGVGVDPVYGPWWVAEEKGFFRKYNINPDLRQFTGGPELGDAAMAGEVDFASSGTATLMPRIARGNLVVIATIATSSSAFKMAVRTSINTPADLRGKKVGTVGGSTTDYLWALVAKKYAIPEPELHLVPVTPPELVPSLDRGDVQAFISWEPWPTRAVEISGKDKVKILLSSGDFGYFQHFITVVNRRFSDTKPDATARVLAAIRDAMAFINAERAQAVKISAEKSRLKPELAAAILDQYNWSPMSLTDGMRTTVREEEAWMRSKGRIKGDPIDWGKTIDARFMEKAMTMR